MARLFISQSGCLWAQAIIRSCATLILGAVLGYLLYCDYFYGESINFGYGFVVTLLVISSLVTVRIILHVRVLNVRRRPLAPNYGIYSETQCLGILDMFMLILAILAVVVFHELDLFGLDCHPEEDDDDCSSDYYKEAEPLRDQVIWLLVSFAVLIGLGMILDFFQSRASRNNGRTDAVPLVNRGAYPIEQHHRHRSEPTESTEAVGMPTPAHTLDHDPTITDGYMGSPELLATRGSGNHV